MPRKTKDNRKKSSTNKKVKTNQAKNTNDNKFNFDEEIVIGLRRLDEPDIKEEKKKKNKSNKQQKNQNNNKRNNKTNPKKDNNSRKKHNNNEIEEPEILIKSKYMNNYEEPEQNLEKSSKKNKKKKSNNMQKQPKKLTKKQEKARKKRKIVLKIVKWLTLIAIIIGGAIYAMLSPIFNIGEIVVQGNSKISSETIISLAGLNIDENIFKYRTSNVEEQIKQEAYIDTVDVKRKLPNTVEITVSERKATYKLGYGNAYAYINNQGYILEVTSVKGMIPLITGYTTSQEDIKAGNRLCTEDLERLEDVLEIMEAASSVDNKLRRSIKRIDISDKNNYVLDLSTEKKTVNLGDVSNLSTKMLWINEFIKREDGVEGTIMLNVDLNNDMPYFNEKV